MLYRVMFLSGIISINIIVIVVVFVFIINIAIILIVLFHNNFFHSSEQPEQRLSAHNL